jgi:hypothetical protein
MCTNAKLDECLLLFLTYRCYRELRLGDDSGVPRWTGDPRAGKCAKLTDAHMGKIYDEAAKLRILQRPLSEILVQFEAVSGFELSELPAFFGSGHWRAGYGEKKWSAIAELTVDLLDALTKGSDTTNLCAKGFAIDHNGGHLIGDGKGVRPRPGCRTLAASKNV